MRPTVIFSGDRDWEDPIPVEMMLRGLRNKYGTSKSPTRELLVVHGANPKGLDGMAEELCYRLGIETDPHPADWNRYGPSAGPRRNEEMLRICQTSKTCKLKLVVGFHNAIFSKTQRGNMRGTRHMLELAYAAEVPTYLVSSWPVERVGR